MEKRSILIADAEHTFVSELEKNLTAAGYDIHVARDGYSALTKARVVAPDLILLDLMIGGLRGLEVKNRLNLEPATVNIPVIFLTDHATSDDKIQGFNLKAEDVVAKSFLNLPELLARLDSLSTRYRERDQELVTDPLSGLNNLHVFKRTLTQLFNVAHRYKRPFSLAVLDLDDLKPINDNHGHATGDQAIRAVAQCMKRSFRETDILIRYGGDEFVILFPESGEKEAKEGVDRFRANIAALTIPVGAKESIGLATSVGLAAYDDTMRRPMDLFEKADKRMYDEKSAKKTAAKSRSK
jgi:diguanylate cyclase (GGDEF)-like protein